VTPSVTGEKRGVADGDHARVDATRQSPREEDHHDIWIDRRIRLAGGP
jgi:hypothetical protein